MSKNPTRYRPLFTLHAIPPIRPRQHSPSSRPLVAMSSYFPTRTSLPSFKWPKSIHSQSHPLHDAPLDHLPSNERSALDSLISKSHHFFTQPPHPLPPSDPWATLHMSNPTERDEILLRLLRFNALSVERSLRQLRATLDWRAQYKIAEQPVTIMQGPRAGIPLVLLDAHGVNGESLFFTSADRYVKRNVDHRIQSVAVAKMFDHMIYSLQGPRVKRGVVVVDFTGFSMKNVDIFGLKNGVSTYVAHYPDIFYRILMVNYPRFMYSGKFRPPCLFDYTFCGSCLDYAIHESADLGFMCNYLVDACDVVLQVWRVIRQLLDERTTERVLWLENGDDLRKELETIFPKTQLPVWLGGGTKDECITLLNGAKIDTACLHQRFS